MTSQRGKRGNPNFKQITGLVPKGLAVRFKSLCASVEQDMSTVLEQLITDWIKKQEHPPALDGNLDAMTFLKKLADGQRPTDAEIVEMAHNSTIQEEKLFMLCDRLVPDKSEEHNGV